MLIFIVFVLLKFLILFYIWIIKEWKMMKIKAKIQFKVYTQMEKSKSNVSLI
jgi:hypothetical protein